MKKKWMTLSIIIFMLLSQMLPCSATSAKVSEAQRADNQITLTIPEITAQNCAVLLAGYDQDGKLLVCSQGIQQEQNWVFQVNVTKPSQWHVYFLERDTHAPLYPSENVTKLFKRNYGEVPIYLGYVDVDYMAEEILKEIDVMDKSDHDKILAVYNWIIVNCKRYSSADETYFDPEEVVKNSQDGSAFFENMIDDLNSGDLTLRIDVAGEMTEPDNGTLTVPYDSSYYIASFAYQMMMYRAGNGAHHAALLTLLLNHLGYDCRLIDGSFINTDGSLMENKWNMVLVGDKYYWLDVRMDDANYERTGRLKHSYFLVEDTAQWEQNHSWDHTYSDVLAESVELLLKAYQLLGKQ